MLLSLLIWMYGDLFKIGDTAPLASELARLIAIGAIVVIWLFRLLWRQIRAARANQTFVTELAQPKDTPVEPGSENVGEVNDKFQDILDQMKRSKLGGRKFLREMPWYVIIGPPGTGKTTALKQSGLHFPIDLQDDLKGIGGTRNCDWFFTEDAIMIDTAGRYVQQKSDPETDAAEWCGFLDLLKKHRGRRSLNGVILTLSVEELLGDEAALREHGRDIRKRLSELTDRLEIQLPVYLAITKMDLLPGFEGFFSALNTRDREQVWGVTLPVETRVDGSMLDREMRALQARLEERMTTRINVDGPVADRGVIFRFPAELDRLSVPLKALSDVVFGESRYESAPWLRGVYFTSATQEGTPLDRMVGQMAASFGLRAPVAQPLRRTETRSYFLKNLLTEVVFEEAGLGTFDPRAEERRRWIWRGGAAASALATVVLLVFFSFSFQRYSGAIEEQERQFTELGSRLSDAATRQAPTDPLDLPIALDAVTEVTALSVAPRTGFLTAFGPSAALELEQAQTQAYDRTLRNVLEPRMVALLEATMWQNLHDPEFMFDALKTYKMMTGLANYDAEFVLAWWENVLPAYASLNPLEFGIDHQRAAIDRMALEETRIRYDDQLVFDAQQTVCTISLAERAYQALLSSEPVASLPEWIPAKPIGGSRSEVFTRLSGKSMRLGFPGAYTFDGFHNAILPLAPEIAAEMAIDRVVYENGCVESGEVSADELERDILRLYYEDFETTWDTFLVDVRLASLTDLNVAEANLKDLATEDSALQRLLVAVAKETYLTRPPDEGGGNDKAQKGILKVATKKLGKIGKLAKKSSKLVGGGGPAGPQPGESISRHFQPIRGMVEEIEGVPPLMVDVTAALTALSLEIKTVNASPNARETLLTQGGLPKLIGGVRNVAATLPAPINDWVAAVAGDATTATREAIIKQLNARLQANVLPFCTSALSGRYPFDPSSRTDVNTRDFARLFGSGGLFDTFINDSLFQFIDTSAQPWQWREDFGFDADQLTRFQQARVIRDAMFAGGSDPSMSFTLEPLDLSANARQVTLNIDGQNVTYFHSAATPVAVDWPGPNRSNQVTLSFTPVNGTGDAVTTERGSWAILRLLRNGSLRPTNVPEAFNLALSAGGFRADYVLQANSVENPFDLKMFTGFSCPDLFR
jgi:type VI secretion system protein ImpL